MAAGPTILYAPVANETIGCPSGNIYTSNLYHLIVNPAPGDINFLTSIIGCVLLGTAGSTTSFVVVTGSTTIVSPAGLVFVNNTSAAAITLTLNSSTFSGGAEVVIVDIGNNFGTFPCTIQPSSGTIRGGSSFAMVVNGEKDSFSFDATNWW